MYVFAVRLIACVVFGTAALSAIDASALALTGVKSRKVHAAAGPFDLAIDTAQAFGASVTVEPRTIGAGHVIVFQFDTTITATGTVTAVDGFGPVGTVSAAITGATNTPVNNEVSVTLTGIPENKRVSIALAQVNGSLDVPAVSMGFLVGDVNNTRSANSSDISSVKARSGQSTVAATYLFDLNASGAVNSSDISAVKARSGLTLSAANEVSLLVSKAGTGAGVGSVSSVPAGINCGVTCAANFVQNTSVTVTASPIGSVFNGWSGACTGTGSTSAFVLAASSTGSANFTINTYAVTPSAGANGSINPLTVQTVNHGATASFTVTANSGFAADVVGTCGGILVGTTYTTNPVTGPCTVVANFISAPLVLYTDILSGPNTGGENNKGIYLSIFGKNFGSTGLGTNTKVFINNIEVDNYRYLGPSRGRPDIQQITVQIGAIGNPTPGVALPIRVSLQGLNSNTDQTFMVLPGNIYFVSHSGSDTNAGTFASPFRHVQTQANNNFYSTQPATVAGAWGRVNPGDFIVMRGDGGTPWIDLGYQDYFLRTQNKSGSAPGVASTLTNSTTSGLVTGTGPITVMGYPAENVQIISNVGISGGTDKGAIAAADSVRIGNACGCQGGRYGEWITITNLIIRGDKYDGAINTEGNTNPGTVFGGASNWRVVNNDLSAPGAENNAKAGGIAGNGFGQFFVGNNIHDVCDGQPELLPGPCSGSAGANPHQNHGIYIDGDGSYEIAYNQIRNISGGNSISLFGSGTNGNIPINNVSIHHNLIDGSEKFGINLSDEVGSGILIYNNIIANIQFSAIRVNNSSTTINAKIYNNTIYNANIQVFPGYGPISLDDCLATPAGFTGCSSPYTVRTTALDIRNNIFVGAAAGVAFSTGADIGAQTIITNNLWFTGSGIPPGTANKVGQNPLFVNTAAGNFRLQTGSPAIDAGTSVVSGVVKNDFDITVARPQGAGFDMGAHER